VNFLGALFGLVLMTLLILPIIMLAGVIAFDWWPILLFLAWATFALARGRVF
jgi:hypothetical protein